MPSFAGTIQDRALPGGELHRCRVCDLRFRWPRLPDYDALYDNGKVETWSSGPLRHDQRLVRQALKASAGLVNVLDFGCYTGGFLAQLDSRFKRFGVEVSKAAAAVARERSGATVMNRLDEFPPGLLFDVIVAMDVVEHVPSPRVMLEQWRARLRPDGRLLLTTGDGANLLWRLVGSRWWYCYFPEHISFISARWLRFHAPRLGYQVHRVETFNYAQDRTNGAPEWKAWLRYLLRPERHAAKRARHLAVHGSDMGVPGMGLTRDHLLVDLAR